MLIEILSASTVILCYCLIFREFENWSLVNNVRFAVDFFSVDALNIQMLKMPYIRISLYGGRHFSKPALVLPFAIWFE